MEPVPHAFFQESILGRPGAVAGVIACGMFFQLLCRLLQNRPSLSPGIQILKVKSSHQHVRLKPAGDIADARMRTSADKDLLRPLPDQQILLVAEILLQAFPLPEGKQAA